MATTASLLESYIVDLTEATHDDETHSTLTGNVISTCIEILLISEDDLTVTYDFPFDGDEWAKKIEARALSIAQRGRSLHTLLWILVCVGVGVTAYAIGAGL